MVLQALIVVEDGDLRRGQDPSQDLELAEQLMSNQLASLLPTAPTRRKKMTMEPMVVRRSVEGVLEIHGLEMVSVSSHRSLGRNVRACTICHVEMSKLAQDFEAEC